MARSLYTTSTDAWRAMLHEIKGARESVYLEMYIFNENGQTHDFVAALENRAERGLRIIIILDAVGSYELAADVRDRLIRAGVEIMYYRYWFHRTHRKLLVVDERIAFVGGVNIGSRFEHWDDLVVRVHGPIVRNIVRSFARAYQLCGGSNAALSAHVHVPVLDRTKMWFMEHGLGGERYVLRQAYVDAIDAAQSMITLVTPYFVPGGWLIAALGRAQKRGVAVTVIMPAHSDFPWIDKLSRYYADMLRLLGTKFYLYPTMLHAKAMLIDASHGVIGSQNLDTLSFERNVESGIFFTRPRLVQELGRILADWKNRSTEYVDLTVPQRWYNRLFIGMLRLVSPML